MLNLLLIAYMLLSLEVLHQVMVGNDDLLGLSIVVRCLQLMLLLAFTVLGKPHV